MMMRRGTICAISTTIVTFGVTPIAKAEPDQSWAGVFLSGAPIKDSKFLVWVDGHARLRDGAEDLDVSIVRPGVGWRVSPTVTCTRVLRALLNTAIRETSKSIDCGNRLFTRSLILQAAN